MGFSLPWNWLAALSCLLCMGHEVCCDCTEAKMQMIGGSYTLTKQLERGSSLIYHCPEGYYPYPHLKRVCQSDGTWQPTPKRFLKQTCRLVECPDPQVFVYGDIFPSQEKYFVGNVTTYDCYSGYAFRGSSTRVCLPNGKWNGTTPICSQDSGNACREPGIPAGASRTGNIFDIDDKVTYSCSGNLFLVGPSERVCQENGQWTGMEPACYYKHTYDTPLEVSLAFGSAIKASLTTEQHIDDDTQEGRIIRISKSGTLNIYIAVDVSESIKEDDINMAKEAVIALIRKIGSFSVSPNYEVIFFASEVTEVVQIIQFMDGKMRPIDVINAIRAFKRDENDVGTNLKNVFTTILERIAIIKEQVSDKFKDHRHALIFFTDGAYNEGGVPLPTVEKIKDMVYMNYTADSAEKKKNPREEYLDIYMFGIGAIIFDEDLQPLTVGTGERHFFRMSDIKHLQHTFDQIIDQSEVQGLCGLHKEFVPSMKQRKELKRKFYPWFAFVSIQTKEGRKNCMGSLVTAEFVLTAAHCLPYGVRPGDITVDIVDGQGKTEVKRVKHVFVHPDYNITAREKQKVSEFYDYDVALIQLAEAVQISLDVRPICIPCTKETSDALQLVGDSNTCEHQEQMMFKDDRERLTFLTRTDNLVDEKDVFAKLGSQREGCIKHALEAPGIDTSDPTVAVTENFLCTGGRGQHRDHIACTGDSGGAVFKNYEHRTIQVALVSWGTNNLCQGGGMVESTDTSRDFHINLFKVVHFLRDVLGNKTRDYAPVEFLDFP